MSSGYPARILGITGGLGTGKSTVASYLINQGIPLWDADLVARQLVLPGTAPLEAISQRYGEQVLTEGQLNRAALGAIIFTEPKERQWLEELLHPLVKADAQSWLQAQSAPTVALVVPLLFEAQMTDLVTEIWVVACRPEIQQQRVRARDHLSEIAFAQRLASQWPLAEKIRLAQVVLDNNGSLSRSEERRVGKECQCLCRSRWAPDH